MPRPTSGTDAGEVREIALQLGLIMELSLIGDLDLGNVKAEIARRYAVDRHQRRGQESSLVIISRAHARARMQEQGVRYGR